MAKPTPSSPPGDAAPSPLASARRLGLLTRNFFPSPEILHIFPVQIRGAAHNDIAFVGESHVEVKEISQSTGRLQHIASQAHFDSRITAAAVLGRVTLADDTAGRAQEPAFQNSSRHIQTSQHSSWPPQALLLVLDAMEIVFLTMKWSFKLHRFCFVESTVQIPLSHPIDGGRFAGATKAIDMIAVDPYSRAFATASKLGHVFFCSCKSQDGVVMPEASTCEFRFQLKVDLYIAKIAFLWPPSDSSNDVFLVVTGLDERRTTVKVLKYDLGDPAPPSDLNVIVPHEYHTSTSTVRVAKESNTDKASIDHSVPQVLLPLMKTPGAFLLACENTVAIYKEAHRGRLTVAYRKPADKFAPNLPAQSHPSITRSYPLWTSWCRPHRHNVDQPGGDEHLYLIREDGCLCYFWVENGAYQTHYAGALPFIVQTAFNHDGRDSTAPDGIVCCGSLSDGGTFEVSVQRAL